jgi:5-methylcytosine-specific restriction enzyme subunit McrC
MRQVGAFHIHPLEFDEFTQDNPLNRLFKAVLLLLRRITQQETNRRRIRSVLLQMDEILTGSLEREMFDGIRFDRQNKDYQILFNMAKMFFFRSGFQFRAGSEHVISFLIPLNALFEKAVGRLVREALKDLPDLEIVEQGPVRWLSDSLLEADTLEPEWQNSFQLRPDVTVIQKDGNMIAILDAKYKNPEKPSREDVYQMVTYASRYRCGQLFLIYPMFLGKCEYCDERSGVPVSGVKLHRSYKLDLFDQAVTLTVIVIDLCVEPDEWVKACKNVFVEP